MSRFLFAPIPVTGHVNPGLPIAKELVRRGHEVVWYSNPRFRKTIERTGARFAAIGDGFPYDEERIDEHVPERAKLKGLAQLKFDIKLVFIDTVPGVLREIEALHREEPFDVVVSDTMSGAPGLLAERYALPWAVYGISVLALGSRDTAPFGLAMMPNQSPVGRLRNRALGWMVDHVIFRDCIEHCQRMRESLGFPRSATPLFDDPRRADVYLQSTVPDFEYPRSDLPENIRFIGPFVPEPPEDWQPLHWWSELDAGRPVILVTQGTIANDFDQLLRPAIRALSEEDALVIVTTGSKPTEAIGMEDLPANVRVERFVPYAHLMPKVDLLLTNGGYGSVQIALSNGVPIVAFGASEDKAEIANRIQWSGVGVGVPSNTPTSAQIRDAVRRAMADPSCRSRAREIAAKMATYNAPITAGNLLEDLVPFTAPRLAYAA